ncbi:MAG: M15 family metallopeptidase [Clostridium sp.]|uniref:M15 family metallopeptidase n=1 Tax=Clostridium sp. TaxID=1506 RepID=UPI003041A3E0
MLKGREKNNRYLNRKTQFYKTKDKFYRNRLSFNKGVVLIIGLLFLLGIMGGFMLNGDINPLESLGAFNYGGDNEESDSEIKDIHTEKGNNTSEIEEVPQLDVSKLTSSEIEDVIQIVNADRIGLFKLANKKNLLDKEYMPLNMAIPNINLVAEKGNERNLVRADIVDDLEQMFQDAKKDGIDLFLSNGFRGFDEQEYLHSADTIENGNEPSAYVAKPGASEHQLGLAVDITSRNMKFELDESFENTKEGQWVLKNAYKYGFILRYIKTKEDITGYSYEPWHYRYIGDRTISKLCHDNNLTLEEIIDYVNNN